MIEKIKNLLKKKQSNSNDETLEIILPAYIGLSLLNPDSSLEQRKNTVLSFVAGTNEIESCTAKEIQRAKALFDYFTKSISKDTMLDPTTIELKLIIEIEGKRFWFKIPAISQLDLTFNVIENMELMGKVTIQSSPYLIASLYADIFIKNYAPNAKKVDVVQAIANAVMIQTEFAEIYAIFDFFFHWFNQLQKQPIVPMTTFVQQYRLKYVTGVQSLIQGIIKRLLKTLKR
jgi:hypothetical protein